MNLRKSAPLFIIFLFMLTILSNQAFATGDAAKIADTMCEYQGRFVYTHNGDWVTWPAEGCGGIKAPNYPPGNYYADSVGMPDFTGDPNAVDLVKAIATKFWGGTEGENHTAIYDEFVKDAYWPDSIEAQDDGPYDYNSADVNAMSVGQYKADDITTSNYRAALDAYYDVITEKFIYVSASSSITDKEVRSGGSDLTNATPSEAQGEASSAWTDDDWGPPGEAYGRMRYTVGEEVTGWSASLYNCRFKLRYNLTSHNGTSKAYAWFYPDPCGWANTTQDDIKRSTNWHKVDEPATGQDTKSDYFAEEKPNWEYGGAEGTFGWTFSNHAIIIVEPDFDTSPDGFETDSDPTLIVHKSEQVAYAANLKCDSADCGEVVDGNVIPPSAYINETNLKATKVTLLSAYDANAAILCINGWNGAGTELTDPTKSICLYDVNSVPFCVKGRVMGNDDAPLTISFKVEFWREDSSGTIYKSEKQVAFTAKPNSGNTCCRKDSCTFGTITAGNTTATMSCGAGVLDDPEITTHDNGDIEATLPGYEWDESFIIYTPLPGFLRGWSVQVAGTDVNIVSMGKIWCFSSDSLVSITDLEGNQLSTYSYDGYGRLIKQEDATNSNYYIQYDYNDLSEYNDVPQTIKAFAYDVNRAYNIEYDANGMAISVTGASCTSCGGAAAKYGFNVDGLVKYEKTYDDDIVYEYVYDASDRFTEKWIGAKDVNNNPMLKKVYSSDANGPIVDIYDYIDANNYRLTREHTNGAGLVTKRIQYEDLNEEPNNPLGDIFIEHNVYYYDSNSVITKKVVIPPAGDSNDPDPCSITGIRKEYTYDPNTGNLLTEKWFAADEASITVASFTYDYIYDGSEIIDTRVSTSTDAMGAVTNYYYVGNDTDPNVKSSPQVTSGISGTQQLKYDYTYDGQNRVTLEKLLDNSDSLIVQTKYKYDDFGNLDKRYDDYAGDFNEVTEYTYNGFGEVNEVNLPSGVIQGWSYYDNGQLEYELVYDPLNMNNAYSQTYYSYDENDRLYEIAKADDPNIFTISDPCEWLCTEYEYDLRGNRTKVIEDVNGLNLETIYQYNNQNEVIKVTLPNGKWTTTIRDGRGQVSSTSVGYGQTTVATTTYEYDENGNLLCQTAPSGIKTWYQYDDYERVVKVTRGM